MGKKGRRRRKKKAATAAKRSEESGGERETRMTVRNSSSTKAAYVNQPKDLVQVSRKEFDARTGDENDGKIVYANCAPDDEHNSLPKEERMRRMRQAILDSKMQTEEANRRMDQELADKIKAAGNRRDGQIARMRLMRRQNAKFAESQRKQTEKILRGLEEKEKQMKALQLKYDPESLPYLDVVSEAVGVKSNKSSERWVRAGPHEKVRLSDATVRQQAKYPPYSADLISNIVTYGKNAMRRKGDKKCDVVSIDVKNQRIYGYRAKDRTWYSTMQVLYEDGTFGHMPKVQAKHIARMPLDDREYINYWVQHMPVSGHKIIYDLIDVRVNLNAAHMFVQQIRDLETEFCVLLGEQKSFELADRADALEERLLKTLGFDEKDDDAASSSSSKGALGRNISYNTGTRWHMLDGPINPKHKDHKQLCKVVDAFRVEIQMDLLKKRIGPVLREMTLKKREKEESADGAK